MQALVVIHTENMYLRSGKLQMVKIFDAIAERIKTALDERVYCLAGNDPKELYGPIKEQMDRMTLIPRVAHYGLAQFLATKAKALEEGVRGATLVGVARSLCVENVYRLFTGNRDLISLRFPFHAVQARNHLGWSASYLDEVIDTTIPTDIEDELTDRFIQ